LERTISVILYIAKSQLRSHWANMHGEFDFSDDRMVDSMGLALPKNPVLERG